MALSPRVSSPPHAFWLTAILIIVLPMVALAPAWSQGAAAAGAACTEVTITLPDRIAFHTGRGVIRAQVRTEIPAGSYEIWYESKSKKLAVAPWGTQARIIVVSLEGSKAQEQRFEACLKSMDDPVPLQVREAGTGGGGSGTAGAGASGSGAAGSGGSGTADSGGSETTGGAATGNPGSEQGQTGGSQDGQAGGSTGAEGGVADTYAARVNGQAHGDPEGGRGGGGQAGDAGARGAFDLFGGILDVPRAWRAAVEIALIGADVASPKAAFKQIAKALAKKTGGRLATKEVREEILAQARDFAAAELKRIEKRFGRSLKKMSAGDLEKLRNSTQHLKERQYFDLAERGAASERARLELRLVRKPGDRKIQGQLREARKIEKAAGVKPVAGSLPRNHEYAGKLYPIAKIDSAAYPDVVRLIKSKRRAGVRFSKEGYPDFTPWMYKEGKITADVQIVYRRHRPTDFRAARDAMRRKTGNPNWEIPQGHTWHHHESLGRMVLVPADLHGAVGHTGGIPHYKMTTGDYDAY